MHATLTRGPAVGPLSPTRDGCCTHCGSTCSSHRCGVFPEVLEPPAAARLPFATPDAALMAAWRDGAAAGLMLDLCYGALPCQPSPAPQAYTLTSTLSLNPHPHPHQARWHGASCAGAG